MKDKNVGNLLKAIRESKSLTQEEMVNLERKLSDIIVKLAKMK